MSGVEDEGEHQEYSGWMELMSQLKGGIETIKTQQIC